MSQHERTGFRDTVFSKWRRKYGKSYLDERHTAQDVDGLEYCNMHKDPLAIIDGTVCQSTLDLERKARGKYTDPMKALAKKAGIECYVMSYTVCVETEEVLNGLFVNCFTLESSGVLEGRSMSRFIHDIHTRCKQCKELRENMLSQGMEFGFFNWKH